MPRAARAPRADSPVSTRGSRPLRVDRLGNVAAARRQRGEDRIEAIDRRLLAAEHQAIAALQSPHAAAGAGVDVGQALGLQLPRAADIVLPERVAAVDDGVAGCKQRRQLADRALGRLARRHHDPYGARRLERAHEVGEMRARPSARLPRQRARRAPDRGRTPRTRARRACRRRTMLAPMRPSPIMPSCMAFLPKPCGTAGPRLSSSQRACQRSRRSMSGAAAACARVPGRASGLCRIGYFARPALARDAAGTCRVPFVPGRTAEARPSAHASSVRLSGTQVQGGSWHPLTAPSSPCRRRMP